MANRLRNHEETRMIRILVVEDSPTQARELQLILESRGFIVGIAPNAQRALDCLRASPFDLVLSDICMPGLSGYDLCRQIKADAALQGMPVILLTALSSPADILQGLECGADNFITKPYDADYLVGRVEKILANKRQRAARRLTMGVELSLLGKPFTINSDKEQILDLLLSTFEEFLRSREREQESRLAQEALQTSQRFLQSALDALSAYIAILDDSGTILAVNTTWRDSADNHFLFGTHYGVGTDYLAICDSVAGEQAADMQALARGIRQILANESQEFRLEYPCRADGEKRWFMVRVTRFDGALPVRVVVAHEDITELKRAEERIVEQAALLNEATNAILVRDLDDAIRFWNVGAERLYGWAAAEAIGRNADELLVNAPVPELENARQAVLEKGEWSGELRRYTRDGREVIVASHWSLLRDESGRPKSKLVIDTDITEKKRLEAQFLRTQRMEGIGALAGGIAHDLNNVLTPILMAVGLLKTVLPESEHEAILNPLQASAERGADMVRQVLSFARGVDGEDRIELHLKHVIGDIEKLFHHTLPKSVRLEIDVPRDLWAVSGDATQLYQVLMNLCVNARDAMPEGGHLAISAENALVDENFAGMHPEARPGPYVLVRVADTGCGIPGNILDKIFEPFFTTKAQGKGTGIGLSTALRIVKSHNGFLNVSSLAGKGSEFSVYLPAVKTPARKKLEEEQPELPVGAGQLILVVDDEAAIREITRGTLEAHGYRVVTAGDGTEAVVRYLEHRQEIQAVLTDLVMPVMDGTATIRALRGIAPNVRIIGWSGLKDERLAQPAASDVDAFLHKPFTAEKLLTTLHVVLTPTASRGDNGQTDPAPRCVQI